MAPPPSPPQPPPWRKHRVEEFRRSTMHLTHEQKGLLIDLQDARWSRQRPLPSDLGEVCRCIGVQSTPSMRSSIKRLLTEFFTHGVEGWSAEQLDEDFNRARTTSVNKGVGGRASGESRRNKATNKRSTNDEKMFDREREVPSVLDEPSVQKEEEYSSIPENISNDPQREKKRAQRVALPMVFEIFPEDWLAAITKSVREAKKQLTDYQIELSVRKFLNKRTEQERAWVTLEDAENWVLGENEGGGAGQARTPATPAGAIRVFRIRGQTHAVYPYTQPGQKDAQYRLAQSLGLQIGTIQFKPGPVEYQQKLLEKLANLEASEADSDTLQ